MEVGHTQIILLNSQLGVPACAISIVRAVIREATHLPPISGVSLCELLLEVLAACIVQAAIREAIHLPPTSGVLLCELLLDVLQLELLTVS